MGIVQKIKSRRKLGGRKKKGNIAKQMGRGAGDQQRKKKATGGVMPSAKPN